MTVSAGTHSHGQGHETVFSELLGERRHPVEQIGYVQGDTGAVAFGRGAYAARSSLFGGVALLNAADAVIATA